MANSRRERLAGVFVVAAAVNIVVAPMPAVVLLASAAKTLKAGEERDNG